MARRERTGKEYTMNELPLQEKTAKGVKGFMLWNPFSKEYFFRVYDEQDKSKYQDYRLAADDIEVELLDSYISLYDSGEGGCMNKLDYSGKALGKKTA
jgi:hypothetical protein